MGQIAFIVAFRSAKVDNLHHIRPWIRNEKFPEPRPFCYDVGMTQQASDRWLWFRLPLVPIVFAVGCVFIAVLAVLQLLILPWLVLYPESHAHVYDYGDDRQRETVRRWRQACRRVPVGTRLANLFREHPRSF